MDSSKSAAYSVPEQGTPVWLIQFNPDVYDIDSALRVLSEVDFTVEDFLDRFGDGDRVYIWRSGENSALLAVGTIMGSASMRKPSNVNLMFYKKAENINQDLMRLTLKIDKVFESPIAMGEFLAEALLNGSQLIQQAGRNSYQLTLGEQSALAQLLEGQAASAEKTEKTEKNHAHAAMKKTGKNRTHTHAPIERTVSSTRTAAELPKASYNIKPGDYVEPSLDEIVSRIKQAGIKLDERLIRRYHLALHSRGFVILAGLSGTGKTWLSKAYADAAGATYDLVCVAPNWKSNEDLLGYLSPFKENSYIDTTFSVFLRKASSAYINATEVGLTPKPFHVVLDEMNLARVEYYFAIFLSKMEERARQGIATLRLGREEVLLPPNLYFIGTVNVDETTLGFSDKVYDRAQLIELEPSESLLREHVGNKPYADLLMKIWQITYPAAPFSFRVVDDIIAYVDHGERISSSWIEAFDEQITQKVLPKVKGADPATEKSLKELAEYCNSNGLPFTHKKIQAMLAAKEKSGLFSFFT